MPADEMDVLVRCHVVGLVEKFVEHYADDWEMPRTFGGHLVGPDAVADLAFTLGWLHAGGVEWVAGDPIEHALRRVLSQADGAETHSFFSYRVAETLARFGQFDDNTLLAGMSDDEVDHLRVACDSTELLPLLDADLLPPNYLAVLARCEVARERLGILPADSRLDELVDRTRSMLTANPKGYLDESHGGAGRYDIYTADLYLFCEPLADRLGDAWTSGARHAIELVKTIVQPDAVSFAWGRSAGVLAAALSFELAALALGHDLTDDRETWRQLGALATSSIWPEFDLDRGIIDAHRGSTTEDYRGPHRRLQMTFDVLAKLAEGAARMPPLGAADVIGRVQGPRRDELVRFDDRAAVWSFRNEALSFVLPLVDGRSSDYLPAPRCPWTFDVPVDSVLACFVPTVHRHGNAIEPQERFAPGGTPSAIEHGTGELTVTHEGFVATRPVDSSRPHARTGAHRTARYVVDGRTLTVHEQLRFDEVPEALTIAVPDSGRPLRVTATGADGLRVRAVPVEGMKEWRTTRGEIGTVVEIEVPPALEVSFDWSIAPKATVGLTSFDAGYVRTLYDPVVGEIDGRIAATEWTGGASGEVDAVHVHWPEWCFGYGRTVDEHRAIAERVRAEATKVVWTQHNLTPHLDEPDVYDPIYQAWADACDLAIHHSEWGRQQVTSRYRFRDGCRHVVIPHPHFGPAMTANATLGQDEAAARLGLDDGREPPAIRIGMIGAPRKEKDLQLVVDALAASGRDDVQLVVWSLSFTDPVPDHPQVVAAVYDHVDRDTYDLRLAACDVIALPFTGHTMLATGTASDLVATGTPALVSDWPYLLEHLGGAAIRAGQTVDSWAATIASLDHGALVAAAAATTELRDRYDPERIANATADAIEELGRRL